jgi:hypothetical protein
LAFVNPATRRALGGIFTGNVPHAYVRNHHAIVLNESPRERNHHAAVSIKAMILTSLVAFGALAVWWHGPGEHLVRASLASPRENVMVSPGDLISAHSKPLRGDHCIACHTQSGQPTMAACLECHAEIRTVLDQRVGYHGKLARDCTSCHKEHQGAEADLRSFDPIAFNHQQARFALNGAHRAAKCDQCHLDHSPTPGLRRYIGLNASSCVDCHANPHRDMPSADCAHCHSEQSWNAHDLRFEHNRDSTFKLDATHIVLACAACHPTKPNAASVFRGTPTACEKCHAPIADAMAGKIGDLAMKSDPHNGRVACAECHRPEVRSATMAQFAAECERCHGPRYRDLLFDWQKSLDDREQSAKLRMQRQLAADPQAMKLWSARLAAAHSAGIHNMQQAIEVLENTGR